MKNNLDAEPIPSPASGRYLVLSIRKRSGGDISEIGQVKAASHRDALCVATANGGMGSDIHGHTLYVLSQDGYAWGTSDGTDAVRWPRLHLLL
jgi:hypothetical protein